MAYDYEILEVKRVPLSDLVLGKGQVRKQNVGKEITELADSIRVVGQLHPIVICESPDQTGKFEILTGQRRFLACKELGKDKIWATILDRPVPEVEAKVISFTENLVKKDPDKADYIDICTHLYNIYGNIKIIHEKTGLSPDKIRQYVKYSSLNPELKEMVDKGSGSDGVDLKTALRVQKALERTGEFKPEVAVALAKEMKGMIGAQQEKVAKEVEKVGVSSVDEIGEIAVMARKTSEYVELRVKLDQAHSKALAKYAIEEGMKKEDAAQSLIADSLGTLGYLETEE